MTVVYCVGRLKLFIAIVYFVFGASTGTVAKPVEKPFSPSKATFTVKAKHKEFEYTVHGLFVLPGESISFEIVEPKGRKSSGAFGVGTSTGTVTVHSSHHISWEAPKKVGLYPIYIGQCGNMPHYGRKNSVAKQCEALSLTNVLLRNV